MSDFDFNHNGSSISFEEVWVQYTAMREVGPVVHNRLFGGFEMVVGYDAVRRAVADAETFSSAHGVWLPASGLPPIPALEFDEPEHSRWRRLMDPPFALSSVAAQEPYITQTVDALLDPAPTTIRRSFPAPSPLTSAATPAGS